MGFLDNDDRKKIKTAVIGALLIALITGAYPLLVGFVKRTDDGTEALREIPVIKARQDTLEIRCARKNFEDALFKQEALQRMEYLDKGQQEIKSDLKWIRENWNQKK